MISTMREGAEGLIVFRRAGVLVDADAGTIHDFRHYGLFRRQRSIPAGEVARVRLWREVVVSKARATEYYKAALVLKDAREVLAVNVRDDGREQARDIARTLARRLHVRLHEEI